MLPGLRTEWSNDGEVLAVAGFVRLPNLECRNEIRFYNRQGALRYRLLLPQQVSTSFPLGDAEIQVSAKRRPLGALRCSLG
jgi:hypothetical protein